MNIINRNNIYIEKGLAKKIPKLIKKAKLGDQYAIITDSVTKRLFGNILLGELRKNKIGAEIFTFDKGEKSKTLKTIEKLAEEMVAAGFDRKDAVIALGGGVVGDIAGFLASIYMRGIPYIQIPTTLLAMVDSAIGGKTGVDLKCGKNLLGTTTPSKATYIDTDYLATLPEKQIRSGLAEIIKYGAIWDKKFFEYLEKNLNKILENDENTITYIVKKSVEIKNKIVKKDLHEKDLRMILNYGHTYGHALEKASNFTLLHGYAISIGMVLANKFAVAEGIMKKEDADRITKLLKAAKLPTTTLKKPPLKNLGSDKKCYSGYIHFVLLTKIGKVKIHKVKCQ